MITETLQNKDIPVTAKGTVLLVVCLYENNFGDILIYQTISEKFKQAGFDIQIVHVNQPLSESRLVEKANNCDFLYFVGGGIIERWAPEVIKKFDTVVYKLKVPYGVVGLSTGEFDYSYMSNSLKLFSEKACFFYTRDEASVETFYKAGAKKLPIVGVDVVFANDHIQQARIGGNIVKAAFRNIPYVDITGDLDWPKWSNVLKKIGVSSLIRDCNDAQKALDIPIVNADILTQIASSRMVVAMRFHIIVVAAMMGVLPIPIAYCPKVRRLANQLGISEYCLSLKEYDKLESVVNAMQANEFLIRSTLQNRVSMLRASANEIINQSIRLVEKCV
jgi:polysaccharide pyruvyl transferase WcaK-like protein